MKGIRRINGATLVVCRNILIGIERFVWNLKASTCYLEKENNIWDTKDGSGNSPLVDLDGGTPTELQLAYLYV